MAKILIVDDDPDFVSTTRIVLERAGHEVIHASSGDAGYEAARREGAVLDGDGAVAHALRALEG